MKLSQNESLRLCVFIVFEWTPYVTSTHSHWLWPSSGTETLSSNNFSFFFPRFSNNSLFISPCSHSLAFSCFHSQSFSLLSLSACCPLCQLDALNWYVPFFYHQFQQKMPNTIRVLCIGFMLPLQNASKLMSISSTTK